MLKRKIYDELVAWKSSSNGTTAMMIDGARRVGKSYIAEAFAKAEYKSYILIDFGRAPTDVLDLFTNDSSDLDLFFAKLAAFYATPLHRRESLIIFDEVQQYPRARQLIKYLVADGRFDYLETGSLIRLKKNVQDIIIPSEEDHIEMFPLDFEEFLWEIGEAAFYGPKLDVNVKPAIGNEYTLSTCQLDFCLPAKFNLSYIDSDGTKKTPVVLHRAILGSLDRFMAYILEETKGNLPLWLAPVQAKILPVKNEDEELNAYSHDLYKYLDDNGIRVEIDERNEKLGYRIREAQMEKVPYLLVLGKNEAADGTVSYRLHGEQNSTTVSREDFLALLKEDIRTKKINPAALK